jgi:tRNA/rRNA methyltransferase
MLHCRGGYLYGGHTDNLERRMDQHERAVVPGFVHDHWPAKLVWAWSFQRATKRSQWNVA